MARAFNIFLSHRYQSPDVNQYFFRLFSELADVQFEVDQPGAKGTNVTRLQRMIRSADGFIGLHPFGAQDGGRPPRARLLEESRYFRLELGLAARARKPVLLCVDTRFGSVITPPAGAQVVSFDHREVAGDAAKPNEAAFRNVAARFFEIVGAHRDLLDARGLRQAQGIGLLLPPEDYPPPLQEALAARVADVSSIDPVRIDWPRFLDDRCLMQVESLDWALTDIGPSAAPSGVAAWLEGRSIPLMRALRRSGTADHGDASPLERTLYGAFEAGYPKDIIRWSSEEQLEQELQRRLERVYQEPLRIDSIDKAQSYFSKAALRKDPVFLSYCGDDLARVEPISSAFRRRFQNVFDYRDGGRSIRPGDAWLARIFDELERSAVAVVLLSPGYVASENCQHEARQIVAARDSKKIKRRPVKLADGELPLPPFLQDTQYLRLWEGRGAEEVVEVAVRLLEEGSA